MAGLGSFIDGAMVGYRFAEGADDYRERKRRGVANDEWLAKARARQEEVWGQQDTLWDRQTAEYNRAQQERSVLEAIGQEAKDTYDPNAVEDPNLTVSTRSSDEGAAPSGMTSAPAQPGQQDAELRRGPPTRPTRNDTAAQNRTDGRPVATNDAAPRRPDPRGLGILSPDVAPARPDAAPLSQWSSHLEDVAATAGLPPQAQQTAAAADRAIIEAQNGRDRDTGAPLTMDEINDRIEFAEHAEGQLRGLIQRAQPAYKGPKPAPRDANRQAGPDEILGSFRHNLAMLRYKMTPATREQADFGPLPIGASRGVVAPQAPGRGPAASPRPSAPDAAPVRGAPPAAMQPPPAAGVAPVAPDAALAPRGSAPGAADVADVAAPPDEGGSPAIVLASQTAPAPSPGRGVVGSDAPVKATEAQRKKAGKTFLDHYAETAVPKIVEYYAGKGDLEKAQAFETWAKDRNTQGLLESYGKAVHSIAIGDEEGGKRYLQEYYNAIDDGYELVDFDLIEPDENGAPTKAVAKLRNEETGEVFTQEFEDRADLITNGLLHVAPERMFERVYDEIKQAAEIAADQLKFERQVNLELVKAGIKLDSPITAKEIEDAKQAISEQALLSGGQNMTDEDLTRLATERVLANRAAAQQANRPPQAAPPPDWRRSSQVAP